MEVAREIPEDQRVWTLSVLNVEVEMTAARGDLDGARRVVDEMAAAMDASIDVQEQAALLGVRAVYYRAAGRYEEAYAAAEEGLAIGARLGRGVSVDAKVAYVEALESALALGRFDAVEELIGRIEAIPPGIRPPSLRAQAARFLALLRAARGQHETAEQGFKTAEGIFREHGLVFPLAVTQLEHGEWLVAQGRAEDAESLLREARATFERLEAAPWIVRADAVGSGVAAVG